MITSRHNVGKLLRFFISTLSIIVACVTSLRAESSQKQIAPEKAIAVIHCNYEPVTFFEQNTGQPSGFAVDIISSVAKRAGLDLSYICKSGWPEMITAVETGEAAISVLLRSVEREKILLFSSPVEITYLSYFARSQSSINLNNVPMGYKVGVIKGSRSYEYHKKLPGQNLSIEGTYQEGIFDLLAGEIDIFAGEESLIQKNARETRLDDRIKKIGKPFAEQERNSTGEYVLFVKDNGVGFPETVDFENTSSLGMQLVNMLAGQIQGRIKILKAEGTEFSITFPGKAEKL
ncbi:MAG: hypothetical protein A2511_11575 [Deltaproteobacteria bacterium RIFOXYD12_FULL_50_9]|nr:MAG: hypothetical protein A2511_11575 [Deltaproteobacteria bacterium RIFOXYD12_FULL_50_9]